VKDRRRTAGQELREVDFVALRVTKPDFQRLPRFRPLWPETAAPPPDLAEFVADRRYDCIVVGAGITGCSAALHLAEARARVCVIDAIAPGAGTSGHANGQVMAELTLSPDWIVQLYGAKRGEAVIRSTARAPDLVFDLIARHLIACDATRTGWIEATPFASGMRSMAKRVASWQRRGEPVELLERPPFESSRARPPMPAVSSIVGAEPSIRFPTIEDWPWRLSALARSSTARSRQANCGATATAGASSRTVER